MPRPTPCPRCAAPWNGSGRRRRHRRAPSSATATSTPFNLLVDPDGSITVLDWTAAAIAPPAFDVALTWLLLRNPPLEAARPLRPVIGVGAAVLARRFLRSYRDTNPSADLRSLDWYLAVHSARVLIDLGLWQRADDPRLASHPWRLVAAGARLAVHRATGISVPTVEPSAVVRTGPS